MLTLYPGSKDTLKRRLCHEAVCCCPWGKHNFLCWGTGYESHPSLITSLLSLQLILFVNTGDTIRIRSARGLQHWFNLVHGKSDFK